MASTPLLGLALPTDGTTSWGTLVNTSITALLDSAIAGTTTLASDADITLTTTLDATNEARQAVLLCTGSRAAIRTITAPARSKTYVLINATTGGFGVKIVGVGPTTGVTVPNGRAYMVAWNGSDFVITGITTVNLTSDVTGTLPVANGGTGTGSFTAGALLKGAGTSAVAVASAADIVGQIGATAVTNATNATNIAGGTAGQIHYQTGVGATGFVSTGTAGQVLISQGSGAPSWLNQSSANTAGAIVTRDGSGNFAAGTITATTQAAGTNNTAVATTAFVQAAIQASLVSATAVTPSGTAVDFTSIPSWVKRITVMFTSVSTNGTSDLQVQLGDSGGVETTGYASVSAATGGGTQITPTAVVTTGMVVKNETGAGASFQGTVVFVNITGTTWTQSHTLADTGSARCIFGSGSKTLSGTLDRVCITTVSGDTFNAGTINILYE